MDKRQYDLQIQQQSIYEEMRELVKAVQSIKQDKPNDIEIEFLQKTIEEIADKYMKTFDSLTRQEEILSLEFMKIEKLLQENEKKQEIMKNQIKQLDEYDDQAFDGQNQNGDFNQNRQHPADQENQTFNFMENPNNRIQKLKNQIDQIQKKISKINFGKGKWFDTDHKDFIKIYNQSKGNDKKILAEGIKLLGMNQTEIVDHLQLYQSYLQLQKQKKLVSQQYKQIKFFVDQSKRQKQVQKVQIRKNQQRLKKLKQNEQRLKKKDELQEYKRKKKQDKQQMIRRHEEEESNKFTVKPLQPAKKKDILERNRILLQNKQKMVQDARKARQSTDGWKKPRQPSLGKK